MVVEKLNRVASPSCPKCRLPQNCSLTFSSPHLNGKPNFRHISRCSSHFVSSCYEFCIQYDLLKAGSTVLYRHTRSSSQISAMVFELQQESLQLLLLTSRWGRCLGRNGPGGNLVCQIVAWSCVVGAILSMLYFYYYLNRGTTWAAFLVFLVLDCGVSFIGLVLILLRPLEILFSAQLEAVPTIDNNNETDLVDETALLSTAQPSTSSGIIHTTTGVQLPQPKDTAITVHACIFLVSFLSSVISDHVATFSQMSDMSIMEVLGFFIMDVIENFFYAVGYLLLSVAYRLIAIALWEVHKSIEEMCPFQPENEFPRLVHRCSIQYEQIFNTTEKLNSRTTLLALIMVALTTLEMASSLHDFFSHEFEWNLETFAILRLLLVLAALILQLALSAADVIYASERIAEELARAETRIRAQIVGSYQQEDGRDAAADNSTAALCKAFGDRVRNFPAKIRFSWFHLTTEWALGLSLLVFSLLLAIIGIQLPGGE